MARNDTQFYDPEQDQDALVRVELDGQLYEMPRSVAAKATQEFAAAGLTPGGQARMTADEFYDSPPAAARPARPKPRPVDMDLTNDPEALAGARDDVDRDQAGMRQASGGDWVDELAAGPQRGPVEIDPFGVNARPDMDFSSAPMNVPRADDAMGRDMMHRALGNAMPQGVERLPGGQGFPDAWANAANHTPGPTGSRQLPPLGPPPAPLNDPIGRDMMMRSLGNASIPSRPATISDPIASGFPDAWANAVNRTPAPSAAIGLPPGNAPDMDLMNDPEALDMLAAGPSPQAPPGAGPQYDMQVNPSQLELDDIRKRISGFRMGAQVP